MNNFNKAKIALVFDWMTTPGGAEKVNLNLHKIFPEAEIFTSIYNSDTLKGFEKAKIHTSFIQKLPFAQKKHQYYLGLMPYAFENFDLSDFDIVISSSHSCAKGVITKPETLHICYCHSPMRYAWDKWHNYIDEYKMNSLFKKIARLKIHKLRIWDRLSAERVDHFIANSTTTQKRISKYYSKNSDIIFPMVDTSKFFISKQTKGYFLAVGRLIPYKKFDLIIKVFNETGLPLKIVGRGIHEEELQKIANGNIEFLGNVDQKELSKLYSECEAYIFPQIEDFGITALESMSSGRPVIALAKGGALDTVIDGETGIYFEDQTIHSLKNAITKYQKNKNKFNPQKIKEHAEKFNEEAFKLKILNYIKEKFEETR